MSTGLRLGEAAALDADDVPTTARTGQVRVRAGKGERPRTVPLTGRALTVVRDWQSDRAGLAVDEPALWVGRHGRLSQRQLHRILTGLAASAGVEGFRPHQLRHTAATRWLRSGVDVVTAAELLGHANLNTTRAYARPSNADLAAAVAGAELDY